MPIIYNLPTLETIGYSLLYTVTYLWIFWALYVIVMGAYRTYLAKRLTLATKFLSIPFIIIGVIIDVFTQYTLATIFFFDLPVKKEYTLTKRLSRYVSLKEGWRYKTAIYVCDNILDIFDPTDNHC